MGKLTEAIKHLIIVNVIVFVVPQFLNNMDLTNLFALHFPKNENFKVWQYVTHMFMHAGFQHLFFNMLSLWMFGSLLEELLGTQRFVFLYFSAGIGAGLIYTLVNYYQFNSALQALLQTGSIGHKEILDLMDISKVYKNENLQTVNLFYNKVAVGASGAIFGVFAAYATYFPNHKTFVFPFPFPIKSIVLVISLVVSDLLLGTFSVPGDNVGRFAHVGGAVVGFIIAKFWKKS